MDDGHLERLHHGLISLGVGVAGVGESLLSQVLTLTIREVNIHLIIPSTEILARNCRARWNIFMANNGVQGS